MRPPWVGTDTLIPHAKDVRMRSSIRVIELGFWHRTATLLVYDRDRALVGDAQLVGSIAYNGTVPLMKLGKIIWLLE
jgi:hypothetical protein